MGKAAGLELLKSRLALRMAGDEGVPRLGVARDALVRAAGNDGPTRLWQRMPEVVHRLERVVLVRQGILIDRPAAGGCRQGFAHRLLVGRLEVAASSSLAGILQLHHHVEHHPHQLARPHHAAPLRPRPLIFLGLAVIELVLLDTFIRLAVEPVILDAQAGGTARTTTLVIEGNRPCCQARKKQNQKHLWRCYSFFIM